MPKSNAERLISLGTPVELAREISTQIENAGGFAPAAAQADSVADDVEGIVADFNSLLAKLRSAGIIAT